MLHVTRLHWKDSTTGRQYRTALATRLQRAMILARNPRVSRLASARSWLPCHPRRQPGRPSRRPRECVPSLITTGSSGWSRWRTSQLLRKVIWAIAPEQGDSRIHRLASTAPGRGNLTPTRRSAWKRDSEETFREAPRAGYPWRSGTWLSGPWELHWPDAEKSRSLAVPPAGESGVTARAR